MSAGGGIVSASGLRREFDLAFARAEPAPDEPGEALLALALEGDPYALRLDDLSFLAAGVEPTPLRTGNPAFLGLAGLRAEVLPVWDLAVLLGYAGRGARPAWFACGAREPRWVAAFGRFDGLRRAPGTGLEAGGGGPAARFTRGLLRDGGVCRAVLDWNLISNVIRQGGKP